MATDRLAPQSGANSPRPDNFHVENEHSKNDFPQQAFAHEFTNDLFGLFMQDANRGSIETDHNIVWERGYFQSFDRARGAFYYLSLVAPDVLTEQDDARWNGPSDKTHSEFDKNIEPKKYELDLEVKRKEVEEFVSDFYASTETDQNKKISDLKRIMSELEPAFDDFYTTNLKLVVSIAKKHRNRGLEMEDLVQAGNMGLYKSMPRFDWRRKLKFSTYATWWIKQSIARTLADEGRAIRFPVHKTEQINRFRITLNTLPFVLSREPTDAEIANEMEISESEVAQLKQYLHPITSLNQTVDEDSNSSTELIDKLTLTENQEPEKEAITNVMKEQIVRLLSILPPREQEVLILRFGLEDGRARTLEEVGRQFHITRERIRQIEQRALSKLRQSEDASNLLKGYTD